VHFLHQAFAADARAQLRLLCPDGPHRAAPTARAADAERPVAALPSDSVGGAILAALADGSSLTRVAAPAPASAAAAASSGTAGPAAAVANTIDAARSAIVGEWKGWYARIPAPAVHSFP